MLASLNFRTPIASKIEIADLCPKTPHSYFFREAEASARNPGRPKKICADGTRAVGGSPSRQRFTTPPPLAGEFFHTGAEAHICPLGTFARASGSGRHRAPHGSHAARRACWPAPASPSRTAATSTDATNSTRTHRPRAARARRAPAAIPRGAHALGPPESRCELPDERLRGMGNGLREDEPVVLERLSRDVRPSLGQEPAYT